MAKDSPRITAVELQNIVESQGQKTLEKNCQTVPTSPRCSGGFQEKFS